MSIFSSIPYIKKQQKMQFEQIKEELIMKTRHPIRFQDWCLDTEDCELYDV
jgi:hypothetical protein